MTISSTTRKTPPYQGNGNVTDFSFGFKVFAAGDLRVIHIDRDGAERVLALDTDYRVRLNREQNTAPGGTVTYPLEGRPLPVSEKLVIIGHLANLQPIALTNQGGFYPHVIEDALDRAAIQIQQLAEATERTFKFPVSDPALSTQLPTALQRAHRALIFNHDGSVAVSADDYVNQTAKTAASAAAAALAAEHAWDAASKATKKIDEATQLGTPADNTVTTKKLVDRAVQEEKLENAAVTTTKLAAGAVTGAKLAAGVAIDNIGYIPADLSRTWTIDNFDPKSRAPYQAACRWLGEVMEFGEIDPNYHDMKTIAPEGWVMIGLRSKARTFRISLYGVQLKNA